MKEKISETIYLKDILFPCVYLLYYKQKVVYVGTTDNLYKKIAGHSGGLKIFDSFNYLKFNTIQEALVVEKDLILEHSPKYNPTLIAKYRKLGENSIFVNRPLCRVDVNVDDYTFHIPYFKVENCFTFKNEKMRGYFKEDTLGNYKGNLIYNSFTYWFHGRMGNSVLTLDTKSIKQRKGIVSRKTRDNSYTYTPQKQIV